MSTFNMYQMIPMPSFTVKIISWLFLFFSFQTVSAQKYNENYKGKQMCFGNGGGFAGNYIEFVLLENGKMFRKKAGEEKFAFLRKIKRKESKALFAELEGLNTKALDLNEKGNMTYYFETRHRKDIHRLSWTGGNSPKPPETVRTFYRKVNALTVFESK